MIHYKDYMLWSLKLLLDFLMGPENFNRNLAG